MAQYPIHHKAETSAQLSPPPASELSQRHRFHNPVLTNSPPIHHQVCAHTCTKKFKQIKPLFVSRENKNNTTFQNPPSIEP